MALRSLLFALVTVGGLSNDAFAASQFDLAHGQFTDVLQSSVIVNGAESRVNYRRLKEDPKALNAYVAALSTVSKREFEGFSQAERLAFLINAYNAFTLKLVVDHYPVKSIRDIGGLFSSPWKIKFFTLLGEERSLNEIEHELIRKQFREPRIHFALVCASIGCPPLSNEAYVASRLNAQLNAQAERFLRNSSKNRYLPKENTLYLSSIFDWYGEDFGNTEGAVKRFVADRMTAERGVREAIGSKDTQIKFLIYDWKLNDSK